MIQINNLKFYIDDIRLALKNEAYLSALALSLSIPDICGKIENSGADDKKKYINWFDNWVYSTSYKLLENSEFKEDNDLKIDGNVCYALRCCFLHSGKFDLKTQNKELKIENFQLQLGKEHKINGNSYSYQFDDSGKIINVSVRINVIEFIENILYGTKLFIERNKDNIKFEKIDIANVLIV